jgi:hypothetical protein
VRGERESENKMTEGMTEESDERDEVGDNKEIKN